MDEQSIRKGALLKSGTPSPNPWDLTPSGQNGWHYNEGTRTEDKAPQGCDLSADSSAGMAGTAAMLRPPQNMQIQTRQRLTYCRPNLVLTMGSTLVRQILCFVVGEYYSPTARCFDVWPNKFKYRLELIRD